MKLDPTLTDDEDKRIQPKTVVQIEKAVTQPIKKDADNSKIV